MTAGAAVVIAVDIVMINSFDNERRNIDNCNAVELSACITLASTLPLVLEASPSDDAAVALDFM